MWMVYLGCGVILSGALLAVAFSKRSTVASTVGWISVWLGSAAIVPAVVAALSGAPPSPEAYEWYLPFGEFSVALDGLSAFFLLPILIVSPLAALYGRGYLSGKSGVGAHYFFFNGLVVSMILLTVARDGILFLIAWEIMALTSFFLVVYDHELSEVREAGWTYLAATHIGTAALMIFFVLSAIPAGSFAFDRIASVASEGSAGPAILFALAVFGFGAKAGIFPLHVWLPEAHPAAPSHVSALMSGVMLKMGVYGLLRALTFLGAPSVAWGWALIVLGVASGLLGVVSAVAQHDIKRMLAYSSVENIGIIFIGIGIGVLGQAWSLPVLTVLGFGGALLHVLNHSMFKGLLFLGAGAVVHETDNRDMNRMGGLLKAMPRTGGLFLVGAASASALPPFNAFVSEFFLYSAGVEGVLFHNVPTLALSAIVLTSLALIGGIAAACFTKCYGTVFLGEPREGRPDHVRDPGLAMRFPTAVLAVLCLLSGTALPFLLPVVAQGISAIDPVAKSGLLAETLHGPAVYLSIFAAALIVLSALIFGLRKRLGKNRTQSTEGVWDCGYAAPTVRMQYSPASFSRPLVEMFLPFLKEKKKHVPVEGYFPKAASLSTATRDWARETLFAPLFSLVAGVLSPFRKLQHGRVHIYVVYIAVTLVALLVWTSGK